MTTSRDDVVLFGLIHFSSFARPRPRLACGRPLWPVRNGSQEPAVFGRRACRVFTRVRSISPQRRSPAPTRFRRASPPTTRLRRAPATTGEAADSTLTTSCSRTGQSRTRPRRVLPCRRTRPSPPTPRGTRAERLCGATPARARAARTRLFQHVSLPLGPFWRFGGDSVRFSGRQLSRGDPGGRLKQESRYP